MIKKKNKKYRVLIIEDKKDFAKYKQHPFAPVSLKQLEISVIKNSAVDILNTIKKFQPDLVSFNAVVVPETWYETIQTIKKNYSTKDTAVFVVSYLPSRIRIEEWLVLGVDDYIPFLDQPILTKNYLQFLRSRKSYVPKYGMCLLYWGARTQGFA